jgi:hypothetical protein
MLGSSSVAKQLAASQGFNPMEFIIRAFYWKDLGKSKKKKKKTSVRLSNYLAEFKSQTSCI